MEKQGKLSEWLKQKCKSEHLSLRQAGAKTGLSHTTIQGIINGDRPSPETIRKLALGFANGTNERLVLQDDLLALAGYITRRPQGELSELLAQLMDKVGQFNDSQLKIMGHFADFVSEIGDED